MTKLSTKKLASLPSGRNFQKLCKSISALEAIICPDWESRYFSYDKDWSETEEFCEMKNGSGDQLLILFKAEGIVINGFAHESQMNGWEYQSPKSGGGIMKKIFKSKKEEPKILVQKVWDGVLTNLPKDFSEFIYGEPVKSIGTTFCIWQNPMGNNWETGPIKFPEDDYIDGSPDLLVLLDGQPQTYKNWAKEYYIEELEEYDLDISIVEAIYNSEPITLELVKSINPELDNLTQLKSDLDKIGYAHKL